MEPSSVVRRLHGLRAFENELTAAQNDRDTADEASLALVQNIVNAVKGHEAFGEDSSLYETMGYVRKSERKSGLKRSTGTRIAAGAGGR